jgi:hypothetical protein
MVNTRKEKEESLRDAWLWKIETYKPETFYRKGKDNESIISVYVFSVDIHRDCQIVMLRAWCPECRVHALDVGLSFHPKSELGARTLNLSVALEADAVYLSALLVWLPNVSRWKIWQETLLFKRDTFLKVSNDWLPFRLPNHQWWVRA